jgi:GNAT superfamily N-acetyltransferase
MTKNDIMIQMAAAADAAAVLDLQKLAFQKEAEVYRDNTIPPLTQTLDELREEFAHLLILKATLVPDRLVGSVRACQKKNTCYVNRLIVHPDFQRQGLGTRLMAEIEACFPTAQRFQLGTGDRSFDNQRLYQKLGYRVFKTEKLSDRVTFVVMEKFVPLAD